jgi:transcription-repair coupling factor (superfamily II helicase)
VIPATYIPDPQTRLILYKRVASAIDTNELIGLKVEFVDRFGKLPAPFLNLFTITELKFVAQDIGIKKIDVGAKGGKIQFNNPPRNEPMKIIKLIQSRPTEFKLRGADTLGIVKEIEKSEDRVAWIDALLNELKL